MANTRLAQRGLSLVEVMVSIVIGLVILLLLSTLTVDYDRQKRITVGSSDIGDASAVIINTLRIAVGAAGYSINFPDAVGCQFRLYREADDTLVEFNATTALPDPPGLFPVFIGQGAAGASDTITIAMGSSRQFAESFLRNVHPADSTVFSVDNTLGFLPPPLVTPDRGDVLLFTQGLNNPCRVREITSRTATTLTTDSGVVRFNEPGGIGVIFNPNGPANNGARITNLGPNPSILQYTVVNQQFTVTDRFAGTANVLLDNVLAFQAQYGFFNPTTSSTDWCDVRTGPGCPAAVWTQLSQIRIAIVLRSPNLDCSVNSPTSLTWGPVAAADGTAWSWGSVNFSALPNARCYRYQVVQSVIPVRNMLWSHS